MQSEIEFKELSEQDFDHEDEVIKRQILSAGSVETSVFTIVILCLGSGILTVAYIMDVNGFLLGSALISLGGCISFYTAMMLTESTAYF
jgi:hypothetical protein